jgi:hypothetical protein
VLVALGEWPGATVTVSGRQARWLSRGRLRCRQLTVRLAGRGGAGRPVDQQLWLPDDAVYRARALPQDSEPRTGQVRRLRLVP